MWNGASPYLFARSPDDFAGHIHLENYIDREFSLSFRMLLPSMLRPGFCWEPSFTVDNFGLKITLPIREASKDEKGMPIFFGAVNCFVSFGGTSWHMGAILLKPDYSKGFFTNHVFKRALYEGRSIQWIPSEMCDWEWKLWTIHIVK